jgi:hypothetical protein
VDRDRMILIAVLRAAIPLIKGFRTVNFLITKSGHPR